MRQSLDAKKHRIQVLGTRFWVLGSGFWVLGSGEHAENNRYDLCCSIQVFTLAEKAAQSTLGVLCQPFTQRLHFSRVFDALK